jgi:hypothetical protein
MIIMGKKYNSRRTNFFHSWQVLIFATKHNKAQIIDLKIQKNNIDR